MRVVVDKGIIQDMKLVISKIRPLSDLRFDLKIKKKLLPLRKAI